MRLAWYEDAWDDYVWWQTQDKNLSRMKNGQRSIRERTTAA